MLRMPALCLMTAAALVGCAPTLPPAVSVNNTRVLESTDAGVRLAVDLVLENPNDFPLKLERVAYEVAVPGAALTTYASDGLPGRTVPAHGVQTVTLTAGLAGRAEGAEPESAGLIEGLAQGLTQGLTETLTGTPTPPPGEAWVADAEAGQVWRVGGEMTYAADRGLRTFLTETGVPLPSAGFSGEGRFDSERGR